MQRLTGRRWTAGRAGERGGAAVLLALLMVPVLGFTALAVDVGALHAERARLQVAADAAAFAVAADCARGACGDTSASAQALVTANAGDARAGLPVVLGTTVTTTAAAPVEHWFAPVLGHDSTRVSASATVSWGSPGGGTAALPLVLSKCEYWAMTGGGLPSGTAQRTIRFPQGGGTTCNHFGFAIRTGYGWLDNGGAGCRTPSRRNQLVWSPAGATGSAPAGCTAAQIAAFQDRTVVLPVYMHSGTSGGRTWYRVYTYAAFRITGYHFGAGLSWNPPCGGAERCIRGWFVRHVEPSDDFYPDPTATPMGASVLQLVR